MKRIVVSLVLVVLVLVVLAGGVVVLVKNRPQPRRGAAVSRAMRVQAPEIQPLRNYRVEIEGYGAAQPRVSLEVAPRVGGRIVYKSDGFRTGRTVHGPRKDHPQGDVLFRIDPEPYRLAVENTQQGVALLEAQLASLGQEERNLQANLALEEEIVGLDKQQLERMQSLRARGVGTENEVDIARAKYLNTRSALQTTQNLLKMIPQRQRVLKTELAAAEVRLRQAKLDLRYTTYYAPATGRVTRAEAELGEQVQAGQVCGEIYGTDHMEIPVAIPSGDIRWLDPHSLRSIIGADPQRNRAEPIPARVTWSIPDGRMLEWTGEVGRIEAGLQAQTRTARLIICVDNTQQKNVASDDFLPLDLNMYCRVALLGRIVPEAFLLPRNVVQPDGSVFLAEPTEKTDSNPSGYRLTRRQVAVARYTDNQAMILPGEGLHPDDRVVLSSIPKPVVGMSLELTPPAEPAEPTTRQKPKDEIRRTNP